MNPFCLARAARAVVDAALTTHWFVYAWTVVPFHRTGPYVPKSLDDVPLNSVRDSSRSAGCRPATVARPGRRRRRPGIAVVTVAAARLTVEPMEPM